MPGAAAWLTHGIVTGTPRTPAVAHSTCGHSAGGAEWTYKTPRTDTGPPGCGRGSPSPTTSDPLEEIPQTAVTRALGRSRPDPHQYRQAPGYPGHIVPHQPLAAPGPARRVMSAEWERFRHGEIRRNVGRDRSDRWPWRRPDRGLSRAAARSWPARRRRGDPPLAGLRRSHQGDHPEVRVPRLPYGRRAACRMSVSSGTSTARRGT